MRHFRLIIILPVVCLFATKSMATGIVSNDTTAKINHTVDGNTSEWKTDKFEVDKESLITYAVDHNANYLYLAVRVYDQGTQMKLMRQGMNLYIDKKGRKREGTGIEFPIKREPGASGGRGGGRTRGDDQNGGTPDPKEMRERLASTMIFLKTFGFEDQEDKQQLIVVENGVSVAFDWDQDNVMHIEYQVPIRFIGNPATLNGKPLGIGWKINGIDESAQGGSGGRTIVSQEVVAVPAGGSVGRGGQSSGRGGNSGASRANAPDFSSSDSKLKEQSIWTKYIINF